MTTHIIATNFEGALNLYHGPDLSTLIRTVLMSEYDLSAVDFTPDNDEIDPDVMDCWNNPDPRRLEEILAAIEVDMVYSLAQ